MAFVSTYKHDIFVSYAHINNEPIAGAEFGWVSYFLNDLRHLLDGQLGRQDAYSMWVDKVDLRGHVPITPEIIDAVHKSATLLVILSPAYLASPWCERENDTFLDAVRNRLHSGSRLFIIEMDKVERSKWPEPFKELKGYPFWIEDPDSRQPCTLGLPKPNPSHEGWYKKLACLSRELVAELRRLKEETNEPPSIHSNHHVAVTKVFLAEVTDDLEERRTEVEQYLDQAGIEVLSNAHMFPRDLAGFEKVVDKQLAECAFFVQLLSDVPGKRPPGSGKTYARLQYDLAKAAGKSILQWRAQSLDLQKIRDVDHRPFLELETVQAMNIEEFKALIKQRAHVQPSVLCKRPVNSMVFVDAAKDDNEWKLGESICGVLNKHGFWATLPEWEGSARYVRESLKRKVKDCDAAIFVYGQVATKWVDQQLSEWRKLTAYRERPAQLLAVFQAPPVPKIHPLTERPPGLKILQCSTNRDDQLIETALRDCIKDLQMRQMT